MDTLYRLVDRLSDNRANSRDTLDRTDVKGVPGRALEGSGCRGFRGEEYAYGWIKISWVVACVTESR